MAAKRPRVGGRRGAPNVDTDCRKIFNFENKKKIHKIQPIFSFLPRYDPTEDFFLVDFFFSEDCLLGHLKILILRRAFFVMC